MKNHETVSAEESTAAQQEALLHRLSRIEGQIGAIKRAIIAGERGDCLSRLTQVKAVHAGVKRFAEAYVEAYARDCAHGEGLSPKFEKELRTIISSAFLL